MSEEQLEFRFSGIQVMSKNVYPLDEGKPVPSIFAFEIKVEPRIQPEQALVIMNVMVTIKDNDNPDKICADFMVWCAFQVVDFEKFIIKNADGNYLIPDGLDQTIKPVSISTVRGVIYSDLKNTYLHQTIMPVIFMTDFSIEPQNKQKEEDINTSTETIPSLAKKRILKK